MNRKPSITTKAALIALLFILAVRVFAHEGFEHVMGTAVKLTSNVLIVKTAKGDVPVKVNDKTELTKNGQKAQITRFGAARACRCRHT
ncbi:MAG TPA: hypothetical protein VMU05_10990 [Dongiaceae bacterium]|nr:hypothetical protein [Dongiaceae bacterium]